MPLTQVLELTDCSRPCVVCVSAEDVLPQLARAVGAGGVYCHGEVTAEEVKVEDTVAQALDKAGAALKVRRQRYQNAYGADMSTLGSNC